METIAHHLMTATPMSLAYSPNGVLARWSSILITPVALRRDAATLTSSSQKMRLSASVPRFGMNLELGLARHQCGTRIPHTSANR